MIQKILLLKKDFANIKTLVKAPGFAMNPDAFISALIILNKGFDIV